MATISGVWLINDIPNNGTFPANEQVNFTSNGETFAYFSRSVTQYGTIYTLRYYYTSTSYVATARVADDGVTSPYWVDEDYRTIDFGSLGQEVSNEFYEWLTLNATLKATAETEFVRIKGMWLFNEDIAPYIPNGADASKGFTPVKVNFISAWVSSFSCIGFDFDYENGYMGYLYRDTTDTLRVKAAYNYTIWYGISSRSVNFGKDEQEIPKEFYTWLTANATQQPTIAEITYNGTTTSLEEGKTATMSCNGKVMASDIVIAFTEAGSVTYNGKITNVEAGKTSTMSCNGKRMESDVVIGAPILPTLTAPIISIDGDTLSIQDEEGLATSFEILVNGEVKSSISAGYTVGVYLEDSAGWTSNVTFEYSKDNGSTWTRVPLTYYETTKITGLEGGFKYRAYCDEGMLYIYENNNFVYSGYQTYTSANKTLTASINISISTGD